MKHKFNSENAMEYFEIIKNTMIREKCNLRNALKIVEINEVSFYKFVKEYQPFDSYVQIWNEIDTLDNDIKCTSFVKRVLNGANRTSNPSSESPEHIYESVIVPSFSLTGEELKEYKEKRPLLDFDAIKEFYDKSVTGEIYRSTIINKLEELILDYDNKGFDYIKDKISKYDLLKSDEEINVLINKVKEVNNKIILQNKVSKYINRRNSFKKINQTNEKLNNLIFEIAELSDEEIQEQYPKINIIELRKTAEILRKLPQGRTIEQYRQEQKNKVDNFGKFLQKKKIANGYFAQYGITTQEKFDKFLAGIPDSYTFLKEQAKKMWNKYNEYAQYNEEELVNAKIQIENEQKYLNTYKELLTKDLMIDYQKLKEKRPEQLEEIERIADSNPSSYYNRKNFRKTNPLGDLIIDDEAKNDYIKEPKDFRMKRTDNFIVQLEGELNIINSILEKKTTIEVDQNDNIEYIEDNYEGLSNEQLLELQTSLSSKLDETESQISALQTSIDEVDEQIKSEKEKQDNEKRKKLIESIKAKSQALKQSNEKIENLKGTLGTKKQELNLLLNKKDLIKGEN